MKEFILGVCTKTVFRFNNNKFYKQTDGIFMRSMLGPVLANIIITEPESNC